MRTDNNTHAFFGPLQRVRFWYALLLVITAIFVIRLFYLQVIRHNYYQTSALSGQLKEYEIPAKRGIIEAHSGKDIVPIVLNETKYTLFVDPKYIKDPQSVATKVQQVVGGNAGEYESKMRTQGSRYVVLAKLLDKKQSDAVTALELKGVGTRETEHRTYPQGSLASQLLGFVNDDNDGKYGLEQAMNQELKGKPGLLKAITDARGVPLASQKDNILQQPTDGKRVVLTVDMGMQQQLEDALKQGLDRAKSKSGSALIMDVKTGEIKAMANYPTYNPTEYNKVEDAALFTNPAVSSPLEVGSIMKPLTAAAAIDKGFVNRNTSYYDPGYFIVDDAKITNIEEAGGPGTKTVQDIIQQSLNTGATWLLMQMGGGQINEQARNTWHDYMTNHYQFGKKTGIEQGYEAEGSIPDPNEGYGLNIQYANSAFGQGMTATPLQMASALASVINGGTYFKPHLVEKVIDGNGVATEKKPEVVKSNVVSPDTSKEVRGIMEFAFSKNHMVYGMKELRPEYGIGTKTGTAQVAKPGGGYYEDRFNGTFLSYVGGNEPEYIVAVRVNEPGIGGYAGARAAAPIGLNLVNMLIDNYGVTPKN